MSQSFVTLPLRVSVLGNRYRSENTRIELDRIGEIFLRHTWQHRKERLAIIGYRSDKNKVVSSEGHEVNGLTTKACKT